MSSAIETGGTAPGFLCPSCNNQGTNLSLDSAPAFEVFRETTILTFFHVKSCAHPILPVYMVEKIDYYVNGMLRKY
jgi:hypothetical protein